MTLPEAYEKVNAVSGSEEKCPEQRKITAFLLANSDYLKYLFDLILANIPPVMLTMISKMMPKGMDKENWYKMPISGIYSMKEEEFNQLFDLLVTMTDYARKIDEE
jgi:hypothetical protein